MDLCFMWKFLWVPGKIRQWLMLGVREKKSSQIILASQNFAAIFASHPKKISHFGIQYPSSQDHGSGKWVPPIVVTFKLGEFPTSMIMGERVIFEPTEKRTPGYSTSSSHVLPPHVVLHPGRQRVHRSSRCQPELFKTVATFHYTGELIAYDIL